jgi:hypothetical protein
MNKRQKKESNRCPCILLRAGYCVSCKYTNGVNRCRHPIVAPHALCSRRRKSVGITVQCASSECCDSLKSETRIHTRLLRREGRSTLGKSGGQLRTSSDSELMREKGRKILNAFPNFDIPPYSYDDTIETWWLKMLAHYTTAV